MRTDLQRPGASSSPPAKKAARWYMSPPWCDCRSPGATTPPPSTSLSIPSNDPFITCFPIPISIPPSSSQCRLFASHPAQYDRFTARHPQNAELEGDSRVRTSFLVQGIWELQKEACRIYRRRMGVRRRVARKHPVSVPIRTCIRSWDRRRSRSINGI